MRAEERKQTCHFKHCTQKSLNPHQFTNPIKETRKVKSVHLPGAASQACMVNPMLLPCVKESVLRESTDWLSIVLTLCPKGNSLQHQLLATRIMLGGSIHQVNWSLSGKQALRKVLLSYFSSSAT